MKSQTEKPYCPGTGVFGEKAKYDYVYYKKMNEKKDSKYPDVVKYCYNNSPGNTKDIIGLNDKGNVIYSHDYIKYGNEKDYILGEYRSANDPNDVTKGEHSGNTAEFVNNTLVYRGKYENGKRNGEGEAFENRVSVYKGLWKDGNRTGKKRTIKKSRKKRR